LNGARGGTRTLVSNSVETPKITPIYNSYTRNRSFHALVAGFYPFWKLLAGRQDFATASSLMRKTVKGGVPFDILTVTNEPLVWIKNPPKVFPLLLLATDAWG
jgi:hypothetical protein